MLCYKQILQNVAVEKVKDCGTEDTEIAGAKLLVLSNIKLS